MPFYSGHWYLPVNPQKCAAINQTVSCPVGYYSHARNLLPEQRLTPNLDITGSAIVKTFIASTCTALILSACLIIDKIKYHFYHKRRSANSKAESRFWIKAVHTIESLLQAISDQQIVAGVALVLAINAQACTISAYHYNLVCSMLLLSGITHLNTLINIPDFVYKGKLVAANRLLAIAFQLVLSGIILSSRNTKSFPSKPSALGVLPAACFENMNALDSLGLQDFVDLAANVTGAATNTTQNATQIWDNIQAATSARSGLGEYITLIIFAIFALLFLVLEFLEAMFFPDTYLHWLSVALSITSEIASAVISFLTISRYFSLRDGMEVEAWFDNAGQDKWTYSQIVPMLLLASGSITLIKAVTESLAGHKARRYMDAAQNAADKASAAKNQVDRGQAQYAKMEDQYKMTQQDYEMANTSYGNGAYNN
ncbi:hypothetical protein K505DRAFT_371395 [Melanomma pulvis-pyrius CBS 109.77]|uniref:Uncharacterized protein n=1 Tax=Melanomma pulvis-pyrius CBS 109.77 TaxID=1314802 RepID=A0A6A6XRJ5_9PLEO|nr:hypothetical protein K505DRAFT_371395 [Melanomma pulvis-pyrius CBS 109.77]